MESSHPLLRYLPPQLDMEHEENSPSFSTGEPVHPLCLPAVAQLQAYLRNQEASGHNFGLRATGQGSIIGKMFGVLVVRTKDNELGYLAAFSGKLAGGNHHARFVPPVFDALTEGSFLNEGMTALSRMTREIEDLSQSKPDGYISHIKSLKAARSRHSTTLQAQLFDQYHFLNSLGEKKSLRHIFKDAGYKAPPAGAGECAAPKLLQYAYQYGLRPVALAEFWWGQSPKSATWKHGHFYTPCREKCAPILAHMLAGMDAHHPCIIPQSKSVSSNVGSNT